MSSTEQGSSGIGTSNNKQERNRRTWSPKEEATLLAALKELVANGWKSDNGFRAGYIFKLEDALKKEDPRTDLKAMPHVNSKLQSWKKSYYFLTQMCANSGVGFSDRGNHMIECEDHLWEAMIKIDSNVRLMRHKMWPMYEDWKFIFGKDRATGEHAEDVAEASKEMQNEDCELPPNDSRPSQNEFSFENDQNDMAYDQVSQSARDDQQPKNIQKKRKVIEELHNVCELLSEMNHTTNARLEHLANRIGIEFDMSSARQEILNQLEEIPDLTLENRFIVCELVAFKAERLDIWKGMKQSARAQYVEHLLKTRGA